MKEHIVIQKEAKSQKGKGMNWFKCLLGAWLSPWVCISAISFITLLIQEPFSTRQEPEMQGSQPLQARPLTTQHGLSWVYFPCLCWAQ